MSKRGPNLELIHARGEAELAAMHYAQERLELASVHVTISDCDYPFNDLPDDLQTAFQDTGHPATRVSTLGMRVVYDRAEQLFLPQEVDLLLDNGYKLRFSKLPDSVIPPDCDLDLRQRYRYGAFFPQLLTQQDLPVIKPTSVWPYESERLLGILNHLGVGIPAAPQRADWQTLQRTLQFSRKWQAVAKDSVVIDPSTSLYLEETRRNIDYTLRRTETPHAPDLDPTPYTTVIAVGLDMAKIAGEGQWNRLKYLFVAEDTLSLPRFAGILAIPLDDTPDFIGFPNQHPIELTEYTVKQPPSRQLFDRMQNTIGLARRKIN